MSRYRNDRDDDYYGGRTRGRGAYDEERFEPTRGGRGGTDYDERAGYTVDSREGRGRDYDDYGRDRYSERAGYSVQSRESRPRDYDDYGRGDRAGFTVDSRESRERDYDDDYGRGRGDDDEGRSLYEEGRDYIQRAFGRGRSRRGPSRSHVRCRDIMTRDVTVATRETTLQQVAAMMRDEDTGVIPVVERAAQDQTDLAEVRPDINRTQANVVGNGKLVGLITDRDIVVRALAEGKDARTTRAEEIMTTDIHTAQPNDRVIDAIRKMGDKQVRRIPVADRDGTLRGIISMADVALETEEDRELAEALEGISSGSSFWSKVFG